MLDRTPPGPLDGIRVLDLATPLAEATGRVFADLGAEVIKIEPPGGCGSRFTPPFETGRAGDPQGSLFWRAWGLGKLSVVLDLDEEGDRERLRVLARGSDVLIESFEPGVMQALAIGADALCAENPSLLYVSVTPFGQTGPSAHTPANDLTLAAAGGLLAMQGDRNRPPVPVGFPEASCHGAVQAAADAILALYDRSRSGRGQHLDTSMQAAVIWTLLFVSGFASEGQDPPGFGDDRATTPEGQIVAPGVVLPVIEPCKDGHCAMTLVLGAQGKRSTASLMRWVAEGGGLDADLAARDWTDWVEDLQAGALSAEDAMRGIEQFKAFVRQHTKAEIHANAVAHKWLIAPCWNAADLLADPQLAAREYWTDVAGAPHAGPFARLSATPIHYRGPAPKLAEHQSRIEGPARTPRAARSTERPAGSRGLLPGLKVADFAWIAAGPLVSKDLANHGATVVTVESEKRIDTMRWIPPWKGGPPNVNTGLPMANVNQSKLGITLDLASEAGREVALRMVDWADVVVESFTPGSIAKLGLGWEALRARKPSLIMLSSCMRGQTGPERDHTGFGLHGAALAGFVAITGWPDRKPVAPWGAYTDFIAPRYSLAAIGAALHHRDRTGEGQYIDLSQIEASIHFLEPLVLDYAVNGRIAERVGHASERACPHAVFAAAGTERYVAIATEGAEQWRGLCSVVPELAALAGGDLDPLAARIARKVELESVLAAWCAQHESFAIAEKLNAAGVPAYPVLRATDLHADPQLAQREFFVELAHPQIGSAIFDGAVTRFSETPMAPRHAGPALGQHTFEVLRDILGYGEDEIADLTAAGALS